VIRFECSCGKRLKVAAAHAGRVVECTACGKRLRVPEAAAPATGPEALAAAIRQVGSPGGAAPATPADDAASRLAALAGAPPRAAAKASAAAPVARAQTPRTPAAVRPVNLLAKRHPSVQSNRQPVFIALGIAAGLFVVLVVVLFVSSRGSQAPAPVAPDPPVHITVGEPAKPLPPPAKGGSGEMFPNVQAETPSAAEAAPESAPSTPSSDGAARETSAK